MFSFSSICNKWCEIYSYFVRWKYKNESSSEWMMGEIDQQNVMLVESNPIDSNESCPNERTLILMIEKWPN